MAEAEFIILTAKRLAIAAILGGLIGYERERSGHGAGLRTQLLVCMGSCLMVLIGLHIHQLLGTEHPHDPTRIVAGIITGIGFLGAGAIIKVNDKTLGLTTAASVWITAAIGIAVGVGFLSGALITTFFSILALTLLKYLE